MLHRYKGFTLIELMIATAILSGLLFLGSFTYQMLASRWQQELGEFQDTLEVTKSFNLLNSVLTATQPYIVLDETSDTSNYDPGFLFIGKENRLLAITKQGLFEQGFPEVFRLLVVETDKGKFNLIYQGMSTNGNPIITAQQDIKFTQEILLFKEFDKIKFNYLGWDGFVERSEGIENNLSPTWRGEFSGLDNQLMPEEMAVLLKKGDKDILFTVSFDEKSLRYLTPYLSQND
ncbi:prepilin-type N-terminal cleavage/methylation domain-containing protein [Pseudoalteromonas gelatinilytica]